MMNRPAERIEHFWSRRDLCQQIGLGVMMLGVTALLVRLTAMFLEPRGAVWLALLFAFMALVMGVMALWLLIPALKNLVRSSRPALAVSAAGIEWVSGLPKSLTLHEIQEASYKELFVSGVTSRTLELSLKMQEKPEIIDLKNIKGDFERLAVEINEAVSGGKPWAKRREYTPNLIPTSQRFAYLLGALILIVYATWGLSINDLYIPGKRGPGMHLHGISAALMAIALFMAAVTFVVEVADHFDRRNNEHWYDGYSCTATIAGWLCAFAAFLSR